MLMPALFGVVGYALLSLGAVMAALYYARWRQLVDEPDERRSHHVPTPRGGGVGIVLSVLILLFVLAVQLPLWRHALLLIAAGLAIIAGIGWWDDHSPLSAKFRLCVHCTAGVLLGAAIFVSGGEQWQVLLAVMLVPAMVNAWNFMDGINGLVSSQVAIVGLAFAVGMPVTLEPLPLATSLSCLIFLPFNFPRARVFLGDVGSGALGYLVAAFTAILLLKNQLNGQFWLAIIPTLPILVDASFTLIVRLWRGEKITQAHREHVYQWAVRSGLSHTAVTLGYAALSILFLLVSLALNQAAVVSPLAAFLCCLSLCGLLWLYARRRFRC